MSQSDCIKCALEHNQVNIKTITKKLDKRHKLITKYKNMRSHMQRTKPENWQISVKEYSAKISKLLKTIDPINKCLEQYEENIKIYLKLLVIDRYISSHISHYPIEYQPWTQEDMTSEYLRTELILTIKNEQSTHVINITAPGWSHLDPTGELIKLAFAEMEIYYMKNNREYHYCRNDFGLIGKYSNNKDEEDKPFDECAFLIYNLKELDIILRKFDSWYGSGLD